ncbi:MAG TPA: hypothetical protein VMB52_07100 [Verrucomicrobiae bacterium]|nr:hypothetical protein [Verrucomicrobiae bacterium]
MSGYETGPSGGEGYTPLSDDQWTLENAESARARGGAPEPVPALPDEASDSPAPGDPVRPARPVRLTPPGGWPDARTARPHRLVELAGEDGDDSGLFGGRRQRGKRTKRAVAPSYRTVASDIERQTEDLATLLSTNATYFASVNTSGDVHHTDDELDDDDDEDDLEGADESGYVEPDDLYDDLGPVDTEVVEWAVEMHTRYPRDYPDPSRVAATVRKMRGPRDDLTTEDAAMLRQAMIDRYQPAPAPPRPAPRRTERRVLRGDEEERDDDGDSGDGTFGRWGRRAQRVRKVWESDAATEARSTARAWWDRRRGRTADPGDGGDPYAAGTTDTTTPPGDDGTNEDYWK